MQAYMVDDIHYLPALENSDHMCIFSTLFDLENPKYNLHKADYVIMKELPAEIEWAEVHGLLDINDTWKYF